uniref:Uncharacterized protein n=1 Tax=Vespula pensylvanica TaxID=30213 RepID=A0A834PC77_VESPE|nr:hypothetical protein H0235_003464 [Vespula pensylvanica]
MRRPGCIIHRSSRWRHHVPAKAFSRLDEVGLRLLTETSLDSLYGTVKAVVSVSSFLSPVQANATKDHDDENEDEDEDEEDEEDEEENEEE